MESQNGLNHVLWLGTGIMLVLSFGIIVLVLSYQNFFSRMKRREAEQLLAVSLASEKSERQRIAADLHDSVSADLVAIRNYLVMLQRSPAESPGGEIFSSLRESVEHALASTRQVSHRLMPPMLDTFGLTSALKDYFERLGKSGVAFSVEGENPEIPSEISYELFRIVQELTTNLMKYGGASRCVVSVGQDKNGLVLSLADDGHQFDFNDALAQATGTGLKNVSSRLQVIGAEMVQQPAGNGNLYRITLKPSSC